ncbi:hypothetical protein PROFUN_14553 [Planoprotostelium fungivorum]|uniref:Uncharacterized protein n=1 Tax=Planoprotostelium fungivorum TaxID=1890364 RepID=A0A2P6MZK1_9EUKA|nr:hypothetical protein PROFUN_14553 [Planoprotostelium fungivorum]
MENLEKELLGFPWFEIILYKQRLIELFGSYVVTIHHIMKQQAYNNATIQGFGQISICLLLAISCNYS